MSYTLLPGQAIHIKDKHKRDNLAEEISVRIDAMESLNHQYFSDIRLWWRQYEAVPRLKVKNFPFKNASNVIIPLTKIQVNALVARTMEKIFSSGHRVWESYTENEGKKELGQNAARYINWQADDNDFNFAETVEDWLTELYVIGTSVMAGNWREVRGDIFVGLSGGKVRSQPILYNRGPILEHVPRELIQWDHKTTIDRADFIYRQYSLTYQELLSRASADSDSWFHEEMNAINSHTGSNGPAQKVQDAKRELDSQKQDAERTHRNKLMIQDHDVREVYVAWPLANLNSLELRDFSTKKDIDSASRNLPMVATIHRKTRQLLRLVAAPYHTPNFPFFDGYYRKRPGRGHSIGVAKELEGMQSSMTTIFNQGIDSQTRANAIWGKTRSKRHLSQPLDPQVPLYDPEGAFEPLQIQGSAFANIQLIQVTQGIAERLTGQGDAQFGRETRMGGHPSPAASTMAMLDNAETLLSPRQGQISRGLSRAGEFLVIVNQQFETNEDGKLDRVLGEIDGEKVKEWIFPTEPVPGNYFFKVKGLGKTLNPDARFNRAMQLFQFGQQYWAGIIAATRALSEGLQVPLPEPIKQAQIAGYLQFMMARNEIYRDLLDAADVDDIERFVFSVENFTGDNSDALKSFLAPPTQQGQPAAGPGPVGGPQAPAAGPPNGQVPGPAAFGAGGSTGLPT